MEQWELYLLAKEAGRFASAKNGPVLTLEREEHGRLLVDCPDLRREILEAGLAIHFQSVLLP